MQETASFVQQRPDPLSAPLPELIRAERVRIAYGHLPLALLATVLNAVALTALLWRHVDHASLLLWLSLALLLSAVRYAHTLGYRKSAAEDVPAWDRRFAFGAIAASVVWGSVAVVIFPKGAFTYEAMAAIILAGMSAGASVTLSSHRGVLQAYLILMLTPLILRLALEGQALDLMLSATGTLFLVMISATAGLSHRNVIGSIRLSLEARQKELALKQAEDQYRYLFEMANDDILIVDTEGNILNANPVTYTRLGFNREEMLGMHVSRLLSPRIAAGIQDLFRRILEQGSLSFESEHISKDGRVMPVEVNAQLIDYHGKEAVLSIARDISERKRTENRLRILSRALEQAGESVIITDRDGLIEYTNPAFTHITGYTPEDAWGKDLRLLGMKRGKRKASLYREMWERVRAGKVWQKELSCRCRDGREVSLFMSLAPVTDDSGDISHFVGIQQDVTEHVELEERLRQAQKMEAIGTLVGGIAHDFNNMLVGITGNLFLAKEASQGRPEVMEKLEVSEKLAFSASRMIQQLLAFARKDIVEIVPMDLNRFILETNRMYELSIPENVAYRNITCAQELPILGDDTQLQQVIINLLNNARDAVAEVENPHITLTLEAFDASPGFRRKHDTDTRRFARISIADNGCGIPDDAKPRIFEPFFTTKEAGHGTGLGLAMVYGTITSHHGLIDVESRAETGTTFHIYLPLQPHLVLREETEDGRELPVLHGRGETLLVVDDDPQTRDITRHILEALDYRVLTATDGIEAIKVFKNNADDIKLVIMDLVMPRLGGARAYDRLHRTHRDLRVVFITSHDSKKQRAEISSLQSEAVILRKPWSTTQLSQTIRSALDRPLH